MALGLTQPLTEMSTKNISWGGGGEVGRCAGLTTLPFSCTDLNLGIESRLEARFSAPVQTDPGAHPASCTMGTGSFLGVKNGRGVTLTPYPLLVPW
jgi:hypothetical protein